jgi:hypothetical protein
MRVEWKGKNIKTEVNKKRIENENQKQWEWVCGWRTLSTVAAGNEDVDKTRDNELTDVSPELVGSTAPNDC